MANDHYVSANDLYTYYGQTNVRLWANLGAVADTGAGATAIDATIAVHIAYAAARFDDRMRKTGQSFNLPIADKNGAVPLTVKRINIQLAGYYLSIGRGVRDFDEKGKPITRLQADKDDALQTIELLVKNDLILDLA
jgi:hypothetical protein